jgi:hypothetical protein
MLRCVELGKIVLVDGFYHRGIGPLALPLEFLIMRYFHLSMKCSCDYAVSFEGQTLVNLNNVW